MNTKLRTEARNDFEIGFPKPNNLVFVKTTENVRKHIYIYIYIYIYIRFVATDKKELIQCQNQTIMRQNGFQKIYWHFK